MRHLGEEPAGIIIGYNEIPVDQELLTLLEGFGFKRDYCQQCLDANKHNHVTTTYYLLLKKKQREGLASEDYRNLSNLFQSFRNKPAKSLAN